MRRFLLERLDDESGVSGNGFVAEGIQFTNGLCALTWRRVENKPLPIGGWSSGAFYPCLDMVRRVHGHGGKTAIRFIDETDPPHELDCVAIFAGGCGCDCGLGLRAGGGGGTEGEAGP